MYTVLREPCAALQVRYAWAIGAPICTTCMHMRAHTLGRSVPTPNGAHLCACMCACHRHCPQQAVCVIKAATDSTFAPCNVVHAAHVSHVQDIDKRALCHHRVHFAVALWRKTKREVFRRSQLSVCACLSSSQRRGQQHRDAAHRLERMRAVPPLRIAPS